MLYLLLFTLLINAPRFVIIYNEVKTMNRGNIENYKKLGLNIAYYRKSAGLSQSQLAEKVNISRTHMSRIETADCAVSLDVIFNICAALNVSADRMFNFKD